MTSRVGFTTQAVVHDIWISLALPSSALLSLSLPDSDTPLFPSTHKLSTLSQATIATSALAAALVSSPSSVPKVSVPLRHVAAEVNSHRLYSFDADQPPLPSSWGPIGGLYKAKDGHVRIHDNFLNHRIGALQPLGLPHTATKEQVAEAISSWTKVDYETAATQNGTGAVYALRTRDEWNKHPQSAAISDSPVLLKQLSPGPIPSIALGKTSRCLEGLRVVELSRVIAGPVAGKALAAHGADVLWVTSPSLPSLPELDVDLSRGKRTVQLDLTNENDKQTLLDLIKDADVIIQAYRPGSLSARGFSPEALTKLNPRLIYANMSAFGPSGPWSQRRGFDSLVQTCSGMSAGEAECAGKGEVAQMAPYQVLDHAAGYLLATGICAAAYHRAQKGGSWVVNVSLAGAMKYLCSLGYYGGDVFDLPEVYPSKDDVPVDMKEQRDTGFGKMTFIKHSAEVEGKRVGWDEMPKALGSDEPKWLSR